MKISNGRNSEAVAHIAGVSGSNQAPLDISICTCENIKTLIYISVASSYRK